MKATKVIFALLVGGALGAGASRLFRSRGLGVPGRPRVAAAAAAAEPAAPAPVRIDLGGAPVRGRSDAPATLVMFADFQCPFCAQVEPTLGELRHAYGDKLRLVWKNEPLSAHPEALPAAEAAMAAQAQGRFWEYHDRLLANQERLGPALYEQIARELGLDLERWKKDAGSVETRNKVIDEARQGAALGAHGTPTFFVNGNILTGAQPVEAFRAAIDQAIAAR